MPKQSNERSAHRRLGPFALLVATAVLWSLGGLLIKSVPWHPLAVAGGRSAVASLVILLALRRPRFSWSWAQLGGALAYAGTVILFVCANKTTTAANAILLQYTAPVYVALFGAWFLRERAGLLDWAAILITLGGMFLFFLDRLGAGSLRGNLLAVASGVCFAALALLLRKQKDGSPLESVLLGNVLTALIGLPFVLRAPMSLPAVSGIALLGTVQLGLSYILYAAAIKRVTALEAILVPVIEPILNPVWVLLFLGERPGPWALAGGVVVIVAVTGRALLSYATKAP
ncbi:MAG: DMT family transporter [Patescibacteria group bacterium]